MLRLRGRCCYRGLDGRAGREGGRECWERRRLRETNDATVGAYPVLSFVHRAGGLTIPHVSFLFEMTCQPRPYTKVARLKISGAAVSKEIRSTCISSSSNCCPPHRRRRRTIRHLHHTIGRSSVTERTPPPSTGSRQTHPQPLYQPAPFLLYKVHVHRAPSRVIFPSYANLAQCFQEEGESAFPEMGRGRGGGKI